MSVIMHLHVISTSIIHPKRHIEAVSVIALLNARSSAAHLDTMSLFITRMCAYQVKTPGICHVYQIFKQKGNKKNQCEGKPIYL